MGLGIRMTAKGIFIVKKLKKLCCYYENCN